VTVKSSAAEQAAPMQAVEVKNFTRLYTKSRQEAIMKELMDIVGGAEAQK